MSTEATPLVEVKNLVKHFPITQGIIIQRQVGAVNSTWTRSAAHWQSRFRYSSSKIAVAAGSGAG